MTTQTQLLQARETTILALLSFRRGGWTFTDLAKHCGTSRYWVKTALDRLEVAGLIRAWYVGPFPQERLYDVVEGP